MNPFVELDQTNPELRLVRHGLVGRRSRRTRPTRPKLRALLWMICGKIDEWMCESSKGLHREELEFHFILVEDLRVLSIHSFNHRCCGESVLCDPSVWRHKMTRYTGSFRLHRNCTPHAIVCLLRECVSHSPSVLFSWSIVWQKGWSVSPWLALVVA